MKINMMAVYTARATNGDVFRKIVNGAIRAPDERAFKNNKNMYFRIAAPNEVFSKIQ